ncbi:MULTISPECIES: phosphotransferase [unclassified Solibacillus]|uniref:phosphotransferase n=2 Tax=Solibacillus TaxID=648800 RepID=UPI0030CF350F
MSIVIKENCWKWDTQKGSYFMKYYEDGFIAQKVKMIHRELENIQFPYHIPVEENEEPNILKQRWFDGKSVDYKRFEHQYFAIYALQQLHETNEKINWDETGMLSLYRMPEKWMRRFERFIANERELRRLLKNNYDDLVKHASNALNTMAQRTVPSETKTILHGDVVHHNVMLRGEEVKLIDFDLASLGEASDEIILWLHRIMPQTKYNLQQAMNDHPYLQIVQPKLHYLNYPNEILRECLFYLKLSDRQKIACYPFIQSIVYEWLKYKDSLAEQIEILQN